MTDRSNIREEALSWLVRTNDPAFADWDGFTSWLEASPAHADLYHELAQSELDLAPLVHASAEPQQPRLASVRKSRLALAASLAAVIAVGSAILVPRLTPEQHVTGPGEVATLDLGGEDRLVMNGGTRLTLAGWNRRTVTLQEGQIMLRLRDADGGTVKVTSGDLELVDIGTVFEVSRDGTRSRVLVSEGAVMADPGGARLRIDPGERLDTQDGASLLATTAADAAQVGAFAAGQLAYSNEPLQNVIEDLRRSTGLAFSLDPAARSRRFSGSLSIAAVRSDPQSLGPILEVDVQPASRGWRVQGKAPRSAP